MYLDTALHSPKLRLGWRATVTTTVYHNTPKRLHLHTVIYCGNQHAPSLPFSVPGETQVSESVSMMSEVGGCSLRVGRSMVHLAVMFSHDVK